MEFNHEGYTLRQEEEENHHIMIFDENGKMCYHASYRGDLLTQKEAEEFIDWYIELIEVKPMINALKDLIDEEECEIK